jgi:hypothetical protein
VVFRWRDYTHGNKQRKMTLGATEFLRRFLQHVLPRGFIRIRQYGFLANRCRTPRLALARGLLGVLEPESPSIAPNATAWRCPHYGGEMLIGLYIR